MKLTGNYFLKKIGPDEVLVPFSDGKLDTSSLVSLNETALFIYRKLLDNKSFEEILNAIVKEYEVEEDVAKQDLLEIFENFKKLGILEDE